MSATFPEMTALETRQMERTAPLPLHDADAVWRVEKGAIDIFITSSLGQGMEGSRTHFVRVETGELIFPFPGQGLPGEVIFLAVGSTGTTLLRFSRAAIEKSSADFARERIDKWVCGTVDRMKGNAFPVRLESLQAGATSTVSSGVGLRSDNGVLWVRHTSGKSLFEGIAGLEVLPGQWTPVASMGWIEPVEESEIATRSSSALHSEGELWAALGSYQELIERWAQTALAQAAEEERARMQAKGAAERGALAGAVANLSALLQSEAKNGAPQGSQNDPLVAACALIGQALHLEIKTPPGLNQARRFRDPLAAIAKASRVRLRRVVLTGDWWRQDGGPILAYRASDSKPVALLPTSPTSYVVVDPIAQTRAEIDGDVAQTLQPVAFTFSRPFPESAITVGRLLKFGFHNTQKDVAMMLALGFGGGALGLLYPMMTGIVFDSIIPSAARLELIYITLALLIAGLASVVFDVIRGLAILRFEAKSDAAVQGAVWDRLLSLPLPFFRSYTAGDLADRANGINALRAIASGAVLNAVLNSLFSIFSFGLLFYYSFQLAMIATALVLIYITVSVNVSLYGLKFQRPIYDLQGKISGQVLQFITGITKLRVAGAEVHAYSVWARGFSQQKHLHLRTSAIFRHFAAFGNIYPVLTTTFLFLGIVALSGEKVSTGRFLAFSAAFGTFLNAMLDLSQGLISLLHAVPIYERAKPILTTLPEVNEAKADPGELRGRIELSRVSFRYKADGPWILKDINIQILPGQFVALVGPSGSGKSTLIRLLLGFDKPEAGTISYDGMDLSGVDIQSVRKQLGVVLQNGKLMPGDVYQNIVGSSQLPIETAWEAAAAAGLDEDIHQMPMGMHTVLSEGAGTFSGGQRQRLMIARAIVAKPRILIFDEATSALDNRTQATVSKSLERLQATRIVIAHRLSTIVNADKIIVVKAGSIVQQGTYDELLNQEGPFAELAKRQLA